MLISVTSVIVWACMHMTTFIFKNIRNNRSWTRSGVISYQNGVTCWNIISTSKGVNGQIVRDGILIYVGLYRYSSPIC
jgi:hypothetical protein